MCQIIHKIKDYSLPFELINSTCVTNPDGFGVMMWDGKKVLADKVYTGKDNDPEQIARFLETLHSEEAFIHFRYKTKGILGTEACHPFKIYSNYDKEVYLMHNGTFSDYGSSTKVDSEEFGEEIVAPLYETFLKSGERKPLSNQFFKQIVNKFSGTISKLVLLDSNGDHVIINEKSGDMFEDKENNKKFWVSNLYSFNKYHRAPVGYTSSIRYGGSSKSDHPFVATTPGQGSVTAIVSVGEPQSVPTTRSGQCTKVEVGQVPKRTPIKSYWKDILQLEDVDDILDMTNEDISDLVDIEPENAKLLIKDLILEIYYLMYTGSSTED